MSGTVRIYKSDCGADAELNISIGTDGDFYLSVAAHGNLLFARTVQVNADGGRVASAVSALYETLRESCDGNI